jgi:transcriptional regulator GlxA family with amidase domain
VEQALGAEAQTSAIAEELGRHPAWIARAYRAWRGEGMVETVRRRRVEHAVVRLRSATSPLADVAAECGFCDQSHMNRAFRAVLARTPLDVRREAALLAPLTRSA